MKISEIDANFAQKNADFNNLEFFNPQENPFKVCGLIYDFNDNMYVRMPKAIASKVSDGVGILYSNTSGGRIRFVTDSATVAIRAKTHDEGLMPHMTELGVRGFSMYVNGKFRNAFVPQVGILGEVTGTTKFNDSSLREITIYFPLYGGVNSVYIGLDKGCKICEAQDYNYSKPILFYGSSITQGGCASRPGNSYDAILARRLDCDYINLGFSGNAKGETLMAEYLSDIDSAIFVLDYDHNAPDCEHLQRTHRPLYDAYRSKHSETPIVLMSKPDFDSDKDYNAKRRDIIKATYNYAKSHKDKNIYFIDGETLFGETERDCCTVDGCHPNDLGFYRMADTVYKTISKIIK